MPRVTSVGVLVVLVALFSCQGPNKAASPPAPALPGLPPLSATGVRVSLVWAAPVDLDLYVTDPALESIYFANPRSESRGRLERDVSCGVVTEAEAQGAWIETVAWTDAPPGRYRVGVDFIEPCSSPLEEVDFRVVAEFGGKREERVAKVARQRFEPIVLEFDVPEKSGETRRKPR